MHEARPEAQSLIYMTSCRCEKVPNKNFEFYEYPGEGHAFMNSSPDIKELMAKADIPTDSDKSSQDKGWKRALTYLGEAFA